MGNDRDTRRHGQVCGQSDWGRFKWGGRVPESAVLGEWRAGEAAAGSKESRPILEQILEIVGSRGFPPVGARDELSIGNRRHLRDAMILEAHTRDGRDVLVTENTKDFIKGDRREVLQQLCRTQIMTVTEFCWAVETLAS